MAYAALDDALHGFDARLGQVRQSIYYCDTLSLTPVRRELGYTIAASAYVWVAAAVEAAVSEMLSAVVNQINAAQLPLSGVRLSLFALTEAGVHDSLQDVRGLKMWNRRVELHEKALSHASCQLNSALLPLDGRTIRPQHLETVWTVFGFPGSPVLSPLHSLALRDLAASRNAVAHGEEEVRAVAGWKSRDDMLRLVERIEELVLNLWDQSQSYLALGLYRR